MDKRNTFFKLKEMLKGADDKIITLPQLRTLLLIHVGSSERTIQSCLHIMGETGLIKDIGDSRFEISQDKK